MTTQPMPEGQPDFEGHLPQSGMTDQIWHKSAPSAVRKALAQGNASLAWEAWCKHLADRSRLLAPESLLPNGATSLNWGLPAEWQLSSPEAFAAEPSTDGAEQRVLDWLDEVAGGAPGVEYAIEALVAARRLPKLARLISSDAWFALLEHLIDAASDAKAIDLDQEPLLSQLLAGEFPLTLAYLFPEIKPCRALVDGARQVLSAGVADLLDGEGLLHGRHFALMRPLLACWTRCEVMGKQLKPACFSGSARRQLADMARHALRFARHGGGAMLGPSSPGNDADFLHATVASGGVDKDRALATLVLSPARGGKSKRGKSPKRPSPGIRSEWAATALLRNDWSPTSDRVAVVHAGQTVRMELGCGKDIVLSGDWSLSVVRDDCELRPQSDWEQVCWVSDADMDYFELEIALDGGVRVQRQLALAHDDRFLFLADAVLGEQPGKLEYRACLPLAAGVAFHPGKESREGCLEGTKRRAVVLPLALAEWRSLWAIGEMQSTDAGLELTHAVKAPRLYAPLFFDLDRRRFTRPHTWRRLTVAESLEARSGEVAVGYRVAIGKKQWLIYRSLAGTGNRTLLGHNLSTEALIARFDQTGEVEPLIEVE